MARAMMMRGADFWEHDSRAAAILDQSDIYPWQKKNALVRWLAETMPMKEPAK